MVFQDISDIPIGYTVPNGRVKPWGTGHAVMSAKKYIDGPFCVINADDYYGKNAFKLMYDYLNADEDRYGMVGYVLNNTLTDNGYVSRGVCAVDNENNLVSVVENTHIERKNGKIVNIGEIETILDENATVSMNMWGFPKKFMQKLHDGFAPFLDKGLVENPIKCEYFLPFVVDDLIKKNEVSVKVLNTPDRWYGVTYKEDKDTVCNAIKKLKEDKVYPEKLW